MRELPNTGLPPITLKEYLSSTVREMRDKLRLNLETGNDSLVTKYGVGPDQSQISSAVRPQIPDLKIVKIQRL